MFARLAVFALILAVYNKQDVGLQASLGLAILFSSVLAHFTVQPFASKELHEVEAISLVASWGTLFCGTVLSDRSVSAGVRGFIAVFVVLVSCVLGVGERSGRPTGLAREEERSDGRARAYHGPIFLRCHAMPCYEMRIVLSFFAAAEEECSGLLCVDRGIEGGSQAELKRRGENETKLICSLLWAQLTLIASDSTRLHRVERGAAMES